LRTLAKAHQERQPTLTLEKAMQEIIKVGEGARAYEQYRMARDEVDRRSEPTVSKAATCDQGAPAERAWLAPYRSRSTRRRARCP
jgi:hypothetical protein